MKQIFTLCIGAILLFNTASFSQINEQFESDSSALTSNCWQFIGMEFAQNSGPTSNYLINGIGSLYALPPVNGESDRIMRTPLLNVGNSTNVSFKYKLNNTLTGQQTRKIEVALTTAAGLIIQSLATINLDRNTNNTTATISFNQTFPVNTPGVYRLAIINSGSIGGGNVRVSVDDFTENGAVIGCMQNLTLPVKLISFVGSLHDNKISVQWAVAENEDDDHFEVEKSADGKEFITTAIVMASEKAGTETYSYNESMKSEKIYYRLRMFDKDKVVTYSKTILFQSETVANAGGLRIVNNPATDKLSLSFTSADNQPLEIKVYDLSGRMQMNQKINVYQGANIINLPLNSAFKTGLYAVEVCNRSEKLVAKFVKQ